MICEAKTEQEMREHRAPTLATLAELTQYIESLENRHHDYGTNVHAMSLAATAAFNFMANKLNVSGFQASCAELDFIRRTRHLDCPFAIIKASDMLYPQCDLPGRLDELTTEWTPWAAEQAVNSVAKWEKERTVVHPDVLEHWKKLAAKATPAAKTEQEAK